MDIFKNKYFWYVIVIIVIIVLIWYFFYHKGSEVTTLVVPPKDTPNSTDSNNNPAEVGDIAIKQMVDNAHADAVSWWQIFNGHNASLYLPIVTLSDTDFVKAYDIWNNEYQALDGKTMKGIIDGFDAGWDDGITIGGDTTLTSIQQGMDDKFSRLNLP